MEKSLYEVLGEVRIRALVERFYELMDSLPEVTGVRALHPESLAGSRDKLFRFLVGWAGGPPPYHERYGHPMLRARHLPFAIGDDEARQWMTCMRKALAEVVPEPQRSVIEGALGRVAMHMRNTGDQAV